MAAYLIVFGANALLESDPNMSVSTVLDFIVARYVVYTTT